MNGINDEKYLNTMWGDIVIGELVNNDVVRFCISTGSRSTPLTASAASNTCAEKTIIYDERSSAFFALGYGQAKNRPAAVITTSGTAVANLFPAVIEAYMSKVPMIVLTADRPFELQDVGANQTIDQDSIFGKYIRWFCNIPAPDSKIRPEVIMATIDYAVYMSRKSPAGPVHLNFMFREPLEPLAKESRSTQSKTSSPYTIYSIPVKLPDMESAGRVRETINSTGTGIISVGRLLCDEDRHAVAEFCLKLGWPVYADITSGLRLGSIGTNIIKHFDQQLLDTAVNKAAAPSAVIHIGGPVTSKRYCQFLSQNRPDHFIVIKPDSTRYDPVYAVTEFIESDIPHFCNAICSVISCGGSRLGRQMQDFKNFYERSAAKAQEIIERYFKNECNSNTGISGINTSDSDTPVIDKNKSLISEISVARIVSRLIPDKSALFLSSSMPIRDMELYGDFSLKSNIEIGTNRGASGIDGIISSAAGISAGSGKPCTVIAGDIAFIHDLNSLAFIKKERFPVIIIIINNNGGGIFDFLPISSCADIFKKYFVAPHGFNFKGAASDFGIDYCQARTCKEFESAYKDACIRAASAARANLINPGLISKCPNNQNNGSDNHETSPASIIEVITDRLYNFNLRKKIKKEIIDWLNSGGAFNE